MTTGGMLARRAPRVALVVGVVVATTGAVWTGAMSDWAIAVAQNAVAIGFLGTSFWRLTREGGTKWWLITTYAAGFAVAQVGWSLLGFASGPTPLHLWPDWLYGLALPVGMVGLLWLAFAGLPRPQALRVLTDAGVVAFGLALISWVLFFELTGLSRQVAENVTVMLFPALDVLAGAIIVTAAIYQPHRPRLIWLAAAIPMAAICDTLSALHRDLDGASPLTSAVLGLSWYAVPALLLVAIATDDHEDTAFPINRRRRRSVTFFVVLGLVGGLIMAVRGGTVHGPMLWLAVGLGASTILNQLMVFRELDRAVGAHGVALAALRSSEEEFRLAFEGAPVGIIVFEDGVMLSANPTANAMLGLDGLVGTPARDFVGFDVIPAFTPDRWVRQSESIETVHHDFEWTRPDGVAGCMHLSLARDPLADDTRVIATVEDVTERAAVTEQLAHLAIHDSLTGLPNRAAFMSSLGDALVTADHSVVVAFLDLDRFKVINDSVGHVTGDRVLEAVTGRLLGAVGDAGSVARLAGDEFTILIVDHDRAQVICLIERVQQALGEPLVLAEGIETYPTASVGVAFATRGEAADDLMARADAAMYRAKERGRNRYELYDETLELDAHAELRLVGELHRAIERQEFRVFYQPVVDARTAATVGFEALIRWQHPQRGLLAPGDFVEAAEASGLIVPIGEWVLREALGQLATWRQLRPHDRLSMAVNLAARQVTDELPGTVAAIIDETGVDPDLVWLELTESALMFDSRNAEAVLGRLREHGVHMTVDDFGTGYSSLTYLQRLPIEGIKLDQSFVAGLGQRERDESICHAVTSLGDALGLLVVAEGVETELQFERLVEMGCAHLQGYLFGRPEPSIAIEERQAAATRGDRGPVEPAWSTSDRTSATSTR